MPSYYIAFWNVENLFDVDGSPARPDWLQRALARELAGWDAEVLGEDRPARAHHPPDERRRRPGRAWRLRGRERRVLHQLIAALDLPGREYDVAHADTADERGIDVAFLFDAALFEKREQFSQVILKRNATRDLFQVRSGSGRAGAS